MDWNWRKFAAGLALLALGVMILATALVAFWLYWRFTASDCGLCDDAASSVSGAPGP